MSYENNPFGASVLESTEASDVDDGNALGQPKPDPIRADTVNLTGNAGEVHARIVNVDRGAIARLQGEAVTVTLKNSGIGAAAADVFDATLEQSGIGAVAARKAKLKGGSISVLAAYNVELEDGAKVYFDLRAGALAGVIVGGMLSAVYGARQLSHRLKHKS